VQSFTKKNEAGCRDGWPDAIIALERCQLVANKNILHALLGTLTVCCMAASAPGIKVKCDKDLHLTQEMSTRNDWGGRSVWSATAQGDTLVLLRNGSCGDECRYEERIVLASLQAKCPTLVRATITQKDVGSPIPTPQVKTATRGILQFQDWKPLGGLVSGRLDAEFSLTFYVSTPAPAKSK
jgi:hypothetical protein